MVIINDSGNLRNTYQRSKIIQFVKNSQIHPTAENVYTEISKEIPSISLATVYRNLNLLASKGELLRLEINGEYHFDGMTNPHHHFVCTDCGAVVDVYNKKISAYALKEIDLDGFKADNVKIIYQGLCKNCLKRRK